MKTAARDYDGMRLRIFGECPDFGEIVQPLHAIEVQITSPAK